ncbi:MAG: GntR family transcriptional regulator [Erysipelotrichaceae bacterium]|nr:GntR family transcriptional regulator [Erysipelotrichaceae bacterium]
MTFSFNDKFPIYMQIIDDIKAQLISEKLKTGDQVDSVRNLALFYGVNPNTIQKALSELEKEGLMKSESTSGRFINASKEKIDEIKDIVAKEKVSKFLNEMEGLGISKDKAVLMIMEE